MRNKILLFLLTFIGISQIAAASSVRDKYNFNSEWLLYVGDIPEAKEVRFQDTDWKKVTLPRPFNEDEAFRLSIDSHDNLETGRELIIDFKANDTIFVTTELDLESCK